MSQCPHCLVQSQGRPEGLRGSEEDHTLLAVWLRMGQLWKWMKNKLKPHLGPLLIFLSLSFLICERVRGQN